LNIETDPELDPGRVASLVRSRGWRVMGGGPTGSTNDDARAFARAGDPGHVAVIAASQSAGRGRFAREWDSPVGGVYVSVLDRADMSAAALGAISPTAGVALAEALLSLDRGLSGDLALKWPNDLLAGGRKVAGILVESSVSGDRVDWLVVGVGVNVMRSSASTLEGAATIEEFVAQDSPALDRERIAAAVIDAMAGVMSLSRDGDGFCRVRTEYVGLSADLGRDVVVRDRVGTAVGHGIVTGFDADGRLLLDEGGVTRAFSAGEVSLRT
jgi:BirA family transcriptional regulator, biotin operon repressor / biotin---[acetyl-CoA-carboxylase] ligase